MMGTISLTKPYKILSLDGGGTWALIQAKVLGDLYGTDTKGTTILKEFELVAANSGGGIVAAGLIADMTPAEILDLFLDEQTRASIFQELPWYKKTSRIIGIGPEFSTDGKRKGLSQVLPAIATNALQSVRIQNRKGLDVRFLITAYDYDRDRAVFFRSDPASPAANLPNSVSTVSVIDAVHASSTAPVQFFDQPAAFGGKRYWDGGVSGLNNPVLVAVVEALCYQVPRENIGVLSIGTGNSFRPLGDRNLAVDPVLLQATYEQGLTNDIKKMAQAVLADPPDTDTFISHVMLGGSLPSSADECPLPDTPIVRMNPLIRPTVINDRWTFPGNSSAPEFQRLIEMSLAVTDQNDVLLLSNFCNGWMGDHWLNQPIRHGPDIVNGVPNKIFCEIGFPTYTLARQAWK